MRQGGSDDQRGGIIALLWLTPLVVALLFLTGCSTPSLYSAWAPQPAVTLTLSASVAPEDPLTRDELMEALHKAEGEIEALMPVEIRITEQPSPEACTVQFVSYYEFLTATMATNQQSLASATVGPDRCEIALRRSESFQEAGYFLALIRHEIGHLLGIRHNTENDHSVMQPVIEPGRRYRFAEGDIDQIRE